jgi:type III secretion protein C
MVTVTCLAIASAPSLHAGEPDWPRTPYDYVVIDQDVRVVLEQFGANTGVRVVLSDAVQGKVHGRLPVAEPRAFLDHLTRMFGLDWYYDGAAVAISAVSETQTRMIALQDLDFEALRRSLSASGVLDPRYQLKPGSSPNSALASGPPRYLELLQQTIAALPLGRASAQAAVAPLSRESLMVFRGAAASRVDFP